MWVEINGAVTRVVNNGWYLQCKENEKFSSLRNTLFSAKFEVKSTTPYKIFLDSPYLYFHGSLEDKEKK